MMGTLIAFSTLSGRARQRPRRIEVMGRVLAWPRHKYHDRWCCRRDDCWLCESGLSSCETCGGAEASLTTECCGYRAPAEMLEAVQDGDADYRDGSWICV